MTTIDQAAAEEVGSRITSHGNGMLISRGCNIATSVVEDADFNG